MRWAVLFMGSGVLAIAVAAGGTALAASKKAETEWQPPSHIQMAPMMLPAGHTRVPITLFLEAATPEKSEGICKQMPRVRDAVLLAVSRQPIPVNNQRLVLDGLDRRLLNPVNRAIGKPLVKKIFVAKGAVAVGAGKIKYRPFAVIDGCANVLRSEREREQARRTGN